jgi:Ran GTPase-activating protein (RanGAP) involved in mRNA processing and transport
MFFSVCHLAREAFRRRAIQDVDVVCEDSTNETSLGTESRESWLERTCTRLRRNDPTIEELELDSGENSFDDDDIMVLSDSLRKNHVVSRLVFRNVKVSENAFQYLTPMLKNTNSITALHLEESGIEGQIAVAMALSLNPMSRIRIVHVKGDLIAPKSAQALGLMLKTNRSLTELRLCHNRIDAESVSCIALGLKCNRGLKILDLLGNRLDDLAVSKIANALAYNESLEFLCLDFNDFGYRGVRSIASMLRQNRHLKELHLFGNRIDSAGAERLAEALYHNSTLETLILSFNQIGDEGAAALAKALTANTSLTKMWFPSNAIGNEGLQAFGEFLPRMKVLEELNVGDFFDNVAAEALLEGLKLNTRLSVLYMESPVYDECWMEDKLDFYLRLNKSGRSLLQTSEAPTALWATALAKANLNESEQGSPDVLFYMLKEKPDLFDFVR